MTWEGKVYQTNEWHCVKSVRIRSYSGPYFLAFGLNTDRYSVRLRIRENTGQKNSKYGYFLHTVIYRKGSFKKYVC